MMCDLARCSSLRRRFLHQSDVKTVKASGNRWLTGQARDLGELADADERRPHRSDTGADQHITGMLAKRIAVGAHRLADAAELALIGGIEQT